ncbi:MAG: DUF2058 family protein [Planctomycetota bacterium]|jgi:uncharacterized protein YaiL (DUF2058 family)
MSNMRDQLKKAKLLSKKQAKKLAHEEKLERTELGREGLEKKQAKRQKELTAIREGDRQLSKEVQAELEAQKRAAAERAACMQILSAQARAPEPGGQGRWFFELADGSLPSLALNESQRRMLQGGTLAIVRTGPIGSHKYGILERALAQRVAAVFPDSIVWGLRGAG